jgi:hypothetical protein
VGAHSGLLRDYKKFDETGFACNRMHERIAFGFLPEKRERQDGSE